MLEKIASMMAVDAGLAGSSIAGTVTEALVNPRSKREFITHFLRALSVGWLLATFVSPAIAERMKLSKTEAVAVAFVGGYAGIKMLNTLESTVLHKIKEKTNKDLQLTDKDS